ncbi:MAG: hypothetical protein GY754_13830, partial [bacterium]|nr:hypothetical protein [bacterium]
MKRMLIVYDTVSGSTGEIAEIIEKELAGKGFAVERTTAAQCGSDTLKSFDGVIIGSPMRFGKFNAPVRKF